MKTIVNFIFTYKEQCDWKIQKEVWQITSKLKKYATDEILVANRIYSIEQDDDIYKQVCMIYQKYRDEIMFRILRYEVVLSEDEEKQAVAFLFNYQNECCEEYEDVDCEHVKCKYCETVDKLKMDIYAKPVGYLKKIQNKDGLATIESINEVLLSPGLVDKLEKEGVERVFFKPVYSKRKRIIGYVFSTTNIIPKGSYEDSNYVFEQQCEHCGNISLKENMGKLMIESKTLNENGIKSMQHVNYSYEYYDGYREIIISPKVQSIIKKYVKEAAFIPVFLRNY